jgi:hypothetical protein
MNMYSRVKWPQMLDVPSIGDESTVLVSDLERSGLEYLVDNE